MNTLYATDPQQLEPLDSDFGEAQMSNGDIIIYYGPDSETQFVHFSWHGDEHLPTQRVR